MEPVAVEAHFDDQGTLRPIAFVWHGEHLIIESAGRQWESQQYRHFLVMVAGMGVFELTYHQTEHRWHLRRKPSDFGPRKRSL
jgi:hypothetical protein